MEDGRREEEGVTVICLVETNFVLFEINCFIIFLFQNLIFSFDLIVSLSCVWEDGRKRKGWSWSWT